MKQLRVIELFAGIAGFGLGCERAGMKVVAHVESDENCRKLLADKFPDVEVTLPDVSVARGGDLPEADIITAGWPCQDLSVAGKRAGLTGERSGLFYHVPRIADETGIDLIVWENVGGLISSDDGRDMLRVVTAFQRVGFSGGWRTLNARYFGLAQRRRRVFGVFARKHIGAGRCAEILSLFEGMRGHPAPRGKARQNTSASLGASAPSRRNAGSNPTAGHLIEDIAGPLGGSGQSGGFRTTDLDNSGAFIPEVARACGAERDGYNDGSDQTYIPLLAGCIQERDAKGADSDTKPGHLIPVAATVTARPFQDRGSDDRNLIFDRAQITSKINRSNPQPGDPCHALAAGSQPVLAFSCADSGEDAGAISPALRSMNFDKSHINGGGQVAVAFNWQDNHQFAAREGETNPLRVCQTEAVMTPTAVRRLTPREYERLQGFPDNWTSAFSDSVRYRMLGNAAPPPMTEWIARRVVAVLAE